MSNRIIEISSSGYYLHMKYNQMIIKQNGKEISSIPIEDISVVILDNLQCVLSTALISKLLSNDIPIISVNEKHSPIGLSLPIFSGNTLQSQRYIEQSKMSIPLKKNLWKRVITKKILNQGKLLLKLHSSDFGLIAISRKVNSGDTNNLEAYAARIYWKHLFNNFKRERELSDQNMFLNYGYAVLRALISKYLCASGLHPSFSIKHHNKYNNFCLSDDIMEPYRPYIDECVYKITKNKTLDEIKNPEKREILKIFLNQTEFNGEHISIQKSIEYTCKSFLKSIMNKSNLLEYPNVKF